MRHIAIGAAISALLMIGGLGARADECSGHNHDTGTVLGAGGGALIGGLASHSVVGAVAGGVVGGLAGNAIARDQDCNHRVSSEDRRDAYEAGRDDQAHVDADRDLQNRAPDSDDYPQ